MRVYRNLYELITSTENLFEAWDIFKRGKRSKPDVALFEQNVEQELFALHRELLNRSYKHGNYWGFWIRDPKVRHIHKATVRDRVLHHAIFKVLNPLFEPTFIPASFSCRVGKGTHKGVVYLAESLRAVSQNSTRPCFVLKCDVRKFFDSIDQGILLSILEKRIRDQEALLLLENVTNSYERGFKRERERERERVNLRKGIPIGNLTSQLLANVYMNEFDQFVKHELRAKYYARYTDDFVIVSDDQKYLKDLLPKIEDFLETRLTLSLHPNKVSIRKYRRGIDFLGHTCLPYCTVLRTKTQRRIFKKMRKRASQFKEGSISEESMYASINSYLGVLSHAEAYGVTENLKNEFWFQMNNR